MMLLDDATQLDWFTRILYIVIFIGTLASGAILVRCICGLAASRCPEEDDSAIQPAHREPSARGKWAPGQPDGASSTPRVDEQQAGANLVSVLRRSLTDRDILLANASSSIPLKQLGIERNEVLIDITQEMLVDKQHLASQHDSRAPSPCFVCKARQMIKWDQLICYAQTTIGVLVYRRNGCITTGSNGALPTTTGQLDDLQTLKQLATTGSTTTLNNFHMTPNSPNALSASAFKSYHHLPGGPKFIEQPPSSSNIDLIPSDDSRQAAVEREQQAAEKSSARPQAHEDKQKRHPSKKGRKNNN